ncbi:MAG TPA: CopG family transcriptional regulator, partial [Kribbella sp.]|nr:CopG family transcriptional regulator [Kribbella sp.]
MTDKDYDAAAEWAEHDMSLPENSKSSLRGADAADFGRELVERSRGGRPSIDPDASPGEKSPVRQVRLPRALDADLEAFATSRKRKPSEIMREALTE